MVNRIITFKLGQYDECKGVIRDKIIIGVNDVACTAYFIEIADNQKRDAIYRSRTMFTVLPQDIISLG